MNNKATIEFKINIGGSCYYVNNYNVKQVAGKMPISAKKELYECLGLIQQEFGTKEQNKGFKDLIQTMGSSWLQYVEIDQNMMSTLEQIYEQLREKQQIGEVILPAKKDIFRAFRETAFDDVKVVLIGQDPYIQKQQAMGLSFSVPDGVNIPPSLLNIYKQLQYNYPEYRVSTQSGNLLKWAQQGVLLLNSILTVRERESASHENIGWQEFTDGIIQLLSTKKSGIVFVMWGSKAQQKAVLIDEQRHKIIKGIHPSPQTQQTEKFIKQDHFIQINEYLSSQGKQQIDWQL